MLIQEIYRDELLIEISSTISSLELCETSISTCVVAECLFQLGNDKSDDSILSSFLPLLYSLLILSLFSLSFVIVTCQPHCETVHLYQYPSLAKIPLSATTTDLLKSTLT